MSIGAASSLVAPSTTTIEYNEALDTQREWDPHDYSRIAHDRAEQCREYERQGQFKRASYLANCRRFGTRTGKCKCGRFVEAACMRCHDWTCPDCGQRRYRLLQWAATHDIDRIINEAQTAIELVLPKPRPHLDSEIAFQHWHCYQAELLAKKLFRQLGGSTLRSSVVDPNSSDTRVRVLFHGACPPLPLLTAAWKKIAGAGAWLRLRLDLDATQALGWTFAATEAVLMLTGSTRAKVRQEFEHFHLIRTSGTHYRAMTKNEIAERHAAHLANEALCPVCKDGTIIDRIPWKDRVSEPIEDIEACGAIVRWAGSGPKWLWSKWDTHISNGPIRKRSRGGCTIVHAPPG